MAKIVLETLDVLCSSSLNENEEQNSGIEVQFCEILLKVKNNDFLTYEYPFLIFITG